MIFKFDCTKTEAQNFQAALYEIERQAKRMAELEAKIEKAKTDNNHCVVADWKFEEYRKRIEEQAKRIAELATILEQSERVIAGLQKTDAELREESQKRYERIAELEAALQIEKSEHEETKYAAAETSNLAFSQIAKQHAALKKLGKAKRERGKALVEERARRTHSDQRGSSCDYHESDECGAAWRNFCDFEGCPHKNEFVAFAREELRQEKLL